MSLLQELKDCYINKNSSADEIITNYTEKLSGDKEKGLLKATAKLLGAYCASPAFNKSRQLDILAENNTDMKILRVLIRNYDQGVENILETYDEYFQLEDKKDFWKFFNKKLNLPEDWCQMAHLEIKTEENEILKLIKKYDKKGYWHLVSGDVVVVEDHLDYLAEKYTLEEIESMLKSGDSSFLTLSF